MNIQPASLANEYIAASSISFHDIAAGQPGK
jgi:hypothetical protein